MNIKTDDIVDCYRVLGQLGKGGMGEVFRVEHSVTRRPEAMKVLTGERVSAGDKANRFMREIQLQARLSHPNIAAVHHAFWLNDDLVMIMELVEGTSLRKILDAGRLPIESALNYACQVLDALSYAHQEGIVHRDVTPSNILITNSGAVKLTDFGLAKTPGDMRLTQSGAVMGSMHYMSPEQVRGSSALDKRSDFYSLGIVLYEMLTGRRPFEAGDPFSLMTAQVQQMPVSPRTIDAGIPPGLEEILMTALAKAPERRFASADAFRNALEEVRGSLAQPTFAKPARVRLWPSSRVAQCAAGALLFCSSLLLGIRKQPASVSLYEIQRIGDNAKAQTQPENGATSWPENDLQAGILQTGIIEGGSADRAKPRENLTVRLEKGSSPGRPASKSLASRSVTSPILASISESAASQNKKQTNRGSWLLRTLGKVVHPKRSLGQPGVSPAK